MSHCRISSESMYVHISCIKKIEDKQNEYVNCIFNRDYCNQHIQFTQEQLVSYYRKRMKICLCSNISTSTGGQMGRRWH
jgi:hypothetical protein